MPVFQPPTDDDVTFNDPFKGGPANSLLRFVRPGARGRNVYLLVDGTYTENEPDYEDIEKTYFGGHFNVVTDAEAASLTAAGYGAFIV